MANSLAPTIEENKVLKEFVKDLQAGIQKAQEEHDRLEVEKAAMDERLSRAEC